MFESIFVSVFSIMMVLLERMIKKEVKKKLGHQCLKNKLYDDCVMLDPNGEFIAKIPIKRLKN
jgi:hypothetical protein